MLQVEIKDTDRIWGLVYGLSQIDKDVAIKAGLIKAANEYKRAGKQTFKARPSALYKKSEPTGALMEALQVRAKRNRPGILVGFRNSKFGPRGPHAHFVDLGTSVRPGGGIMPASHFWTNAKEITDQRAGDIIFAAVSQAIERLKDGKHGGY